MTKILAIDTSTDACSAALLNGDKITHRFIAASRQHTRFILHMIDELLTDAQINLDQLDAIAFGCGPGSFTGVRLAASVVQGIALAKNLPVIKISTLRAMAQEMFSKAGDKKVFIAQDARMDEVYWGEYQSDENGIMQPIVPDKLMSVDYAKSIQDAKIYSNLLAKAQYVAKLAAVDFNNGLAVSANQALPVYLREEIAWKKSV